MDTSGFYKNEDDSGNILYGPNYVINLNYELRRSTKDEHTYPIDGWYWFDSIEDAYNYWNLPLPNNQQES